MSCYCECPVALSHGAVGFLQFVIVVFPDHSHFLYDQKLQPLGDFTLGMCCANCGLWIST